MKTETNISLKAYHTFSVDCKADSILFIENEDDIIHFIENHEEYAPFYILGKGSNVLFAADFRGTIVLIRNRGISIQDETEDEVTIKVAAGEDWEDFVVFCIFRNYYGIENLAGIPGLVGSSPVQNIGAYGMEVKDSIVSVEGYSINTGKKRVFSNEECQFGYRLSIFKKELKNRFIISSVTFRLSKREKYNLSYAGLRDVLGGTAESLSLPIISKAVISLRNSKLPNIKEIGSAGSFFKNPIVSKEKAQKLTTQHPDLITFPVDENQVKIAAGKLIEMAGWKGVRQGDVGVYPKQALVLVNYGGASGSEIVDFYQKIIDDIDEKFGISLEPEVNIII